MSGHNAIFSLSVHKPELSRDPEHRVRMKTRCYSSVQAEEIERRLWEELSYNDFEWLKSQIKHFAEKVRKK